MLLDDYMPHYQFNEVHSLRVHAPIERVYRAFQELTAGELSPLVGVMLALRDLPARISSQGKQGIQETPSATPFLAQMQENGFLILAEKPPEEIVFGLIGQFWKLDGGAEVKLTHPEEFTRFNKPDFAKTAANFLLVQESDGSVRVSTETRVETPTPEVHRKFGLYWRVIALGSGLIRVLWLQAVKRRAEKGLAKSAGA